LLERINGEAIRLLCPELADVFVRREAFEGLQALGEVIGGNEVCEVTSELVVGFVIEAFDRRIFDRSVHAFDLAVSPRMLGLGEAMIDVGFGAGVFEGVGSEWLLASDQLLDLRWPPALATRIGEVKAVVGEYGVDFVGNSGDQV
jgi:hypothetical protein